MSRCLEYLQVYRKKGVGIVNTVVAVIASKLLIEISSLEYLKSIDIKKISLAKSLFLDIWDFLKGQSLNSRMGYKRRRDPHPLSPPNRRACGRAQYPVIIDIEFRPDSNSRK